MWWFYSLNGFIVNILFLILLEENPINWQIVGLKKCCAPVNHKRNDCVRILSSASAVGRFPPVFKNISSVLKVLILLAVGDECCKERRPLVVRICSVLLAQMEMLAALELHANFRIHTHMDTHTHTQTLNPVPISFCVALSVPLRKWPWRPKIGAATSPWAPIL